MKAKPLRTSDAGLTPWEAQQWERAGALPSDPKRGLKKRSFTPPEAFALLVGKSLRVRHGVSLENLAFLGKSMLGGRTNYLFKAQRLVMEGVGAWVATDLRTFFFMGRDGEVRSKVAELAMRGEGASIITLRLDSLVMGMWRARADMTMREAMKLGRARGAKISTK